LGSLDERIKKRAAKKEKKKWNKSLLIGHAAYPEGKTKKP